MIRQVVCGTAIYGSHKGPDNKGNICCIYFFINEALRRVNDGYSFYDKIKPILLQIHKWIGLILIFTVQL